MLTSQIINKYKRPFLSKTFLLQKVGTKFYLEQDPDPHFFQGSNPDPVFFNCRIQIRFKIVWICNTVENGIILVLRNLGKNYNF
jgi:hypothetical protein